MQELPSAAQVDVLCSTGRLDVLAGVAYDQFEVCCCCGVALKARANTQPCVGLNHAHLNLRQTLLLLFSKQTGWCSSKGHTAHSVISGCSAATALDIPACRRAAQTLCIKAVVGAVGRHMLLLQAKLQADLITPFWRSLQSAQAQKGSSNVQELLLQPLQVLVLG